MKSNKSGCRGCLIWMTSICAGFALVVGVALYLGYLRLSTLKDDFTQSTPMKLPVVTYTSSEIQSIDDRVGRFLLDAQEGASAARLNLSEKEVNTLVSSSGFSNLVYVTITNSSFRAQVSIPIESLAGLFNRAGMGFLKGRYLNGEGTISVAAPDGNLTVKVRDLAVNGRQLPEHYMARIRSINMAEGVATNAATRASLRRISRIATQNGALILEVAPVRD